jgi:integrase
VFAREDGSLLHPSTVSRAFCSLDQQAGLRTIRLHDLRHTHAALALQTGVHPKIVQERLGHASISLTLDTYSHVAQGMQEQAAQLVAALITHARTIWPTSRNTREAQPDW